MQERDNDQDQPVENVVTIQVGLSGLSQLLFLRYKGLFLLNFQFYGLSLFIFGYNMVSF